MTLKAPVLVGHEVTDAAEHLPQAALPVHGLTVKVVSPHE
jgi:hypothetical protein